MNVLVGMTGEHVNIGEIGEHLVENLRLPGHHHFALAGIVEQRHMAAKENACVRRHVGKVFLEPLDVLIEEPALVVAPAVDVLMLSIGSSVVDILHAVHKNPVVGAYVHRIAGRAPGMAVIPGRFKIGKAPPRRNGTVIVVVAAY